ncbi:hypothetical protein ITJ64_03395 [Herbiconiux sp. VKM Ac-1786]|uniref:hypothetical protein n=1 Tax=Herbiconiux sp. VKM Ac-1786 TaxID=2783824 RepID=UPI00188D7779|nr:hypothetical protein [Herbiconiux sp. VKM Ac-1786]MBF4571552.1 hypothetical protein [Herbiconiux sp. VKM Ac-1786]
MIDIVDSRHGARLLLEDSYATYPHSNGFVGGGSGLVLGIAGGRPRLVRVDPAGPAADPVEVVSAEEFRRASDGVDAPSWSPTAPTTPVPWFDVALETDVLVTCWGNQLLLTDDLERAGGLRPLYRPETGWVLHELMSISADGSAAYVSESDGVEWTLRRVDVGGGGSEPIVRLPWHANHVHPVPADESWLLFSHEGPAATVPDRMWAIDERHASAAGPVFDQLAFSDTAGTPVSVGHERGMFHEPGAVVVAYGESPTGPRGLVQTFLDGRPPRLVSAGDRDWHCGISRDGRQMVVDTSGPWEAPGRGWADAGRASSIVLVDAESGARRELARTGFIGHPYHPHPSFTPDGTAVLFNHVEFDELGEPVARGAALVPVSPSHE